jgi:hypothetical protein
MSDSCGEVLELVILGRWNDRCIVHVDLHSHGSCMPEFLRGQPPTIPIQSRHTTIVEGVDVRYSAVGLLKAEYVL